MWLLLRRRRGGAEGGLGSTEAVAGVEGEWVPILYWLADSGYSFEFLVTPNPNKSKSWNDMQKALCSVVEVSIGMVLQNVEVQELGLLTCYKLTKHAHQLVDEKPNI